MILYQLNKKQDVIGIASSDILSATFEEQINTAGNLKFTTAKKLRDDCLYVLFQRPNATTYMCFKILTETQEDNQVSYTAVESAYDELGAYSYIKDLRPQNRTAKEMLTQILAQTRYSVGYIANTGQQSTNFYYTTVLASLQSVVNLFNLEITFDVVFDPIDNQVKRRLVNLYQKQGARTGRRFEYGDKLLSVTREQSSDELVTALVGRGSSVQVSEGTDGSPDGYSRKITFADVVWKKSAGDPLDKPAGQEYLEDPSATAVYGFSDGKPRIGFVEFDKITDPALLLKATYDKLQELKRPKVSFKASVTDVGSLNLGDTVAIIRHDLKIEYLTRVYKVTHDLLNAQNNTIELGDDFQKASITSTISAVQDTVQSAKEYSQSALQSANSKNTNFYGTSQPLYAVEGDLWYKDLSNGETEMYQYQNGNWELITSTAELHNTQKEVDQAIKDFNTQFKEIDDKYVPNETYQTEKQAFSTAVTKASETAKEAKATADTASANATEASSVAAEARTKVDDVAKTVTKNGKAIGEIKSDVSGVKATYATLDGKVTSASARAGALEAALSDGKGGLISVKAENNRIESLIDSKVDGSEYNTFKRQTSTELSQKANKTDLNGYVTSTQFKQSADKIETVAADVKNVKTKAENIENTMKSTSFANSIVKASGIDTKVAGYDTTIRKLIGKDGTTGDLNTLVSAYNNETSQTKKQTTNLISALDYNATTGGFGSGFSKKVADAYGTTESYKSLNGKIDGLQIGGANLLDDTAGPWKKVGIGKDYTDAKIWTLNVQPHSTTITVSFDCRANTSKSFYCFFFGNDYNANGRVTSACNSQGWVNTSIKEDGMVPIKPSTVWGRVWIRYNLSKIPSAGTKRMLIGRLFSNYSTSDWLEIRNVKLESGNKATDWCMSDNDVNKRIQDQADALTAYQAEVKRTYALSSSVYTKTETQTRENALKSSTISDLKATDDWKKLIKINQNSSWIQDATGFQQQAWKYNLDSSSQLIGKKSFEDENVGSWTCNDYKTKATVASYHTYGYTRCIYASNNNDLYWNVDCKVKPGDKYYVELLVPNSSSVHGGRAITVTAYFKYTKDGKSAWQAGPHGQVAGGNSGWIKGIITVPDGVTSVKPCISAKDNGKTSVVHLTYASFTKLDDYTQSNMTSIKQSSDGIGLKVAQLVGGSDISKIDMTSAAVKIDSKHILLNGDVAIDGTTFAKKIKATGITADMMLAGTIDAAKINVINIDASKITTGVLTAKIAKLMGSNNSWMSLDGSGIHAEGGTAANKDQWTFKVGCGGYYIKRQEKQSGDYRWTGGLAYGENMANTNANGLGLIVCPSSSGGNGDEISIGKVVKGNFDGGYEWTNAMRWSATGYGGVGTGFHWYDTCTLENDKARTIYTGGKDPFYIRNIRWGNSGNYYPSIQVGYNENTKSSSGIAFRWDDIKPWGTMNMENVEISCGASNKLRFTWCQWSNWYQQWKIPAISNRVSPTSGIAFASGGIREFAGSKVRDL